jgi:hypothetical protein
MALESRVERCEFNSVNCDTAYLLFHYRLPYSSDLLVDKGEVSVGSAGNAEQCAIDIGIVFP